MVVHSKFSRIAVVVGAAVLAACMVAVLAIAVKPAEGAFSGRNGKIVFEHYVKSGCSGYDCGSYVYKIYVVNSNGSNPTRLTNSTLDLNPAWSPSGKKIAFSRFFDNLRIMNADGSGSTLLLKIRRGWALDPAWSPDGRKLVFENFGDLYTINVAHPENGPQQITSGLTNRGFPDEHPAWSPDGTKILFDGLDSTDIDPETGRTLLDREIYMIDAAPEGGTNLRIKLTDNVRKYDTDPAWSPSGKKIAFSRAWRNGSHSKIYTMSVNGSNQINLTRQRGFAAQPAYSPSGTKIAFSGGLGDSAEIYKMNWDGSGKTRLTKNDLPDYHPDWQPLP